MRRKCIGNDIRGLRRDLGVGVRAAAEFMPTSDAVCPQICKASMLTALGENKNTAQPLQRPSLSLVTQSRAWEMSQHECPESSYSILEYCNGHQSKFQTVDGGGVTLKRRECTDPGPVSPAEAWVRNANIFRNGEVQKECRHFDPQTA